MGLRITVSIGAIIVMILSGIFSIGIIHMLEVQQLVGRELIESIFFLMVSLFIFISICLQLLQYWSINK